MSTAMLRRHKTNRDATKAKDLNVAHTETPKDEAVDLGALSYKELQELGKERGIENVNIKKDKLKKLLSEAV